MNKLHILLVVILGVALSGLMILDYKARSVPQPPPPILPNKQPLAPSPNPEQGELLSPFLKEAQDKNLHVLWFLSKDNCLPCVRLDRVIDRSKSNLVNFYTVKAKDTRMDKKFGVTAYPTLVITNFNGTELARSVGFLSDGDLRNFLSSVPLPEKKK